MNVNNYKFKQKFKKVFYLLLVFLFVALLFLAYQKNRSYDEGMKKGAPDSYQSINFSKSNPSDNLESESKKLNNNRDPKDSGKQNTYSMNITRIANNNTERRIEAYVILEGKMSGFCSIKLMRHGQTSIISKQPIDNTPLESKCNNLYIEYSRIPTKEDWSVVVLLESDRLKVEKEWPTPVTIPERQ
jgi:hypothetical protein